VSELVYSTSCCPGRYLKGWELQRACTPRVADDVPDSCSARTRAGVHGGQADGGLRPAVRRSGAPVIDVDRGGKITWHGPGQLTGYPIIKLREPLDVVAYVRALEEA